MSLNDLLNVFIGAILSLVIAVIIHMATKQKKQVVFNYLTRKLISNYESKYNGLLIKYNDANIKSLYATKLILWNKGKSSICNNDIAINDPLKFNVGEKSEILDVGVIGVSDDSISPNINILEDMKTLSIIFDHLNYNDGFVIQLLHTENNDDFNVSGTLKCYKGKISKTKNLREIEKYTNPLVTVVSLISDKISRKNTKKNGLEKKSIFGLVLLLLINVYYLINLVDTIFGTNLIIKNGYQEPTLLSKIAIVVISSSFIILSLVGLIIIIKRRIPKNLQKYL